MCIRDSLHVDGLCIFTQLRNTSARGLTQQKRVATRNACVCARKLQWAPTTPACVETRHCKPALSLLHTGMKTPGTGTQNSEKFNPLKSTIGLRPTFHPLDQ